MTFAATQWVHALWLVLGLVVFLLYLERRGSGVLSRFVAATMQQRLVQRASSGRRVLRIACIGMCGLALVIALMRPQWGVEFVETPRASAELMVCLDVSKSMLAEDVAPNRLERAKAEIEDLLPYLNGDHVGLIAFAGTASVACPLTPDYGFLRLVLDEIGTHSVRRGGTQLAEPIRKAVAGFGAASDVSRAIILITDGEDHDSYPIEAAMEAAELGIKIIAIGFGDEVAGSEIYYTDPQTGSREVVRHDGAVVRSRLDGDTLREIIAKTDGVYVPAGTAGLLDLESIYAQNIAPMTRGKLDGRGRAVRKEGFQWAILAAILFLVAAAALTGQRRRRETVLPALTQASSAAALLLLVVLGSQPALAQTTPAAGPAPTTQPGVDTRADTGTNVNTGDAAEGDVSDAPALEVPADARDAYNAGCTKLSTSAFEEAEELFLAARRQAGTDLDARFAATYNLAWVYVHEADRQREDEPEAALKSLQTAADWFRDAVRLRPDNDDARHNLEVVLARALALADSLRKQEELTERLDRLIDAQRQLAAATRPLVEQAMASSDPNLSELMRESFRAHARSQRALLSDSGSLVDDVATERSGIDAMSEEQQSPEDKIRGVQLDNALHYLHRARERMGQTRKQFRRKQAERGYRRAAASLTELKRARDQLRDPVEVLTAVIGDLQEQARSTQTLATADNLMNDAEPPPMWLTVEYLQENQEGVTGRTGELRARLEAGVEHAEKTPTETPEETTAPSPEEAEEERVLAMVKEALPFVQQGESALQDAATSLETSDLTTALQAQVTALQALLDARERFLDLRGLIEASYATECQLQQLLVARHGDAARGQAPLVMEPLRAGLVTEQGKNLERSQRLEILLDAEIAKLPDAAAAAPGAPQGQEPDAERQRFDRAKILLIRARKEMARARDQLRDGADTEENWSTSQVAVDAAVKEIEELRRLFFSIIEHLQETARRQMELNDSTEEAIHVGAVEERPARIGPLVPRQEEIGAFSEQIATALTEQAAQGSQGAPPGTDPAQAQEQAQRIARAAELVTAARQEMEQAGFALGSSEDEDSLNDGRTHQDTALQQLAQALALLQPPQDQQQQQDQQEQQEQQQAEQGEQKEEDQASSDPAQLLQGIRDREAERRKDKNDQKNQRYEPVEKDW
ncbi:MAG: VWA domain-containing protein [Planctomycetota bacterium]